VTTLDPATVQSALYALLATSVSSAAVAVRAALGNGAASIITRDNLDALALPLPPFLVFASGQVNGAYGWDVQRMEPAWWLYDDPVQGFTRIDALIPLIDAAIPPDDPTVIPYCDVRRAGATQPIYDSKLGGRPTRSLPYRISWR
jgi:hypothetical protein